MANESSLLDKLEGMNRSGELGALVYYLIQVSKNFASLYTNMGREKTANQVLTEWSSREIHAKSVSRDASVDQETLKILTSRSGNDVTINRRFSLCMDIIGTKNKIFPIHLEYNGSWEGLESEMKQDAEKLNGIGFHITYLGHSVKPL